MSELKKAIDDKKQLEVEILGHIYDYQQKHPGLIVEAIAITITKVNFNPPIQSIEAYVKIS